MSRTPSIALLDTNLLLLHLVGSTDPSLLTTFKRVDRFDAGDLALLERVLHGFQDLIATPHILAETSNFVDQAPQYRRRELIASLRSFAEEQREVYQTAKELVRLTEFPLLGLADTGLFALSFATVIVTKDFHLSGRITSRGGHCGNFNHLRSKQLLPI